MKIKDIVALLKRTVSEWSEDKAPRLAAALAYYTVFSLAPLLVIVIAIAGFFFGAEAVQNQVVNQISGLVGQESAEAIQTMIAGARDQGAGLIATIIGIVTLLFAAGGVFGQLQDALNTIWEVAPKPDRGLWGLIKDRFLSFSMILGVGFLLLVSLVLSAALAIVGEFFLGLFPGYELIITILNFAISFGVIMLLFGLIFKILPDAEVAWRDVWLGAALTALLFVAGRFLIQLYIANSDFSSSYGAAGSLIVILLWIYYSAQILFFGAEFTQVYANMFGSRIVPQDHAVALTEEARANQGIPQQEALEQAAETGGSAERALDESRAPAGGAPARDRAQQPAVGFLPQTGREEELPPGMRPVSQEQSTQALRPTPLGQPSPGQVSEPIAYPAKPAPAWPAMLAFSALVASLIGFLSGMVVRRGPGR